MAKDLHEAGDGGGLSLLIARDGSKRWVYIWDRNGKRREMGLGAAADISLAKARDLAAAARQLLVEGIDPLEDRRAQEAAVVEAARERSEEHTSELQSLMRISYAVCCLKKKKQQKRNNHDNHQTKKKT